MKRLAAILALIPALALAQGSPDMWDEWWAVSGTLRVPVTGAVLWVDASTLSAGSFDAATTPVNNLGTRGGSFNAGPYSVNATGINGKPALQFDGIDDYLKSTDAYANSGNVLTLFVVTKRISDNGTIKGVVSCIKAGWADWNHVECFSVLTAGTSGYLGLSRNQAGVDVAHPAIGTPFISTAVFSGSTGNHYIKTSASSYSGSFTSSGNFDITSTVLGARQEAEVKNFNNINIGEVLIYNSALSDSDRLAVEAYLAAKWAIM